MRRFVCFVTSICLAVPLFAWNAEGHMLAAQIAYNHLNPTAKSECDSLISVVLPNADTKSNTFVTAACWADDFKSALGTGTWHYIDIPFSLDGTPTDGVAVASFDVVKAIEQSAATLTSPTETAKNKATSLRYLIHFVADVHMPLHCSTAVTASKPGGDAGGNGFYVTGTWNNLHSLWDSGGGLLSDSLSRPLSSGAHTTINNKIAGFEADYPYVATTATASSAMIWAEEGKALAEAVAYVGVTRNAAPSAAYLNTVQVTAEEREATAGHRLANLLNTIFTPTPVGVSRYELQ